MKKRIIYLSSFILIILGIGIFIDQAFFKPTVINSFIATKIYSSPANNYFTDENFYKCVVDAYNKENSTSLPYTTSLSDSQLGSIKKLSCDGYYKSDEEKIKNTNGLEKLTALTYLSVGGNQLTNIDVSNNTALTYLNVTTNQLTSLNVSSNTALTYLYVSENHLTELDVSNNIALIDLEAADNQLTELDVSKNTALTYLYVSENNLTSLDFSKNVALKKLYVHNNTFVTNTIIYKGGINVDNDNRFVKLPEGKSSTLTSLKSDDNDVNIDDNNINIASTKNKDVINYAVSLLLDDDPRGNVYNIYHIKTKVKGDTYKFTIYVTEDDYNYINNKLVNDKGYLETLEDYKDSRIFGIGYDNGYTGVKENKELTNMVINEYKNNQDVLKNVDYNDGSLNISLYIYDNYAVRNVVINVIDNKDLVLNILKYYNTKTKEYLNKMNDNDIYYYGNNGKIKMGKVNSISDGVYTLDNEYALDKDSVLGNKNKAKSYAILGSIYSILTSKWGYLFIIIFPMLIAFVYEIYEIVKEIKKK